MFKISVDASFSASTLSSGIACICRTNSGEWVQGLAGHCFAPNSYMAELFAILAAVHWAKENSWMDFFIMSDGHRAVNSICESDAPPDEGHLFSKWCRDLMLLSGNSAIVKVLRRQVEEADFQARQARLHLMPARTKRKGDSNWISEFIFCNPPPSTTELVSNGNCSSFGQKWQVYLGAVSPP